MGSLIAQLREEGREVGRAEGREAGRAEGVAEVFSNLGISEVEYTRILQHNAKSDEEKLCEQHTPYNQ